MKAKTNLLVILILPFYVARTACAGVGEQTAQYMTRNYNNVVENCGSLTRPAFLCSGVLFRATNPDTSYNSWDPSPASVKSGGVSFSYLRKDAKFNRLAYGYLNGFALYPYSFAPDGKNTDLDLLCAFPIDAATNNRSEAGCGRHVDYSDSYPCQVQGIFTPERWAEHYNIPEGNKRTHQCGFVTSEHSGFDVVSSFNLAILSMAKIPDESIKTQNEIRIKTWDTTSPDYPGNFPIEAFFYIYKQVGLKTPIEKGLIAAQHDQESYFYKTKIWVPIIRISLPETILDDAKFEYNKADQKISEDLTGD
ncbi:hypothetical protein JD488_10020 [Aeromonas jandaei]|uniref:hypothetical protein n=1 Tax=Aeromonas jandaei TaxID=650 RepID=UPI00191D5314|nr:hypothetical protein [Aeromonas jandaei]MBL0667043.1 hypothetical protein [Aeromonas jandaei]